MYKKKKKITIVVDYHYFDPLIYVKIFRNPKIFDTGTLKYFFIFLRMIKEGVINLRHVHYIFKISILKQTIQYIIEWLIIFLLTILILDY